MLHKRPSVGEHLSVAAQTHTSGWRMPKHQRERLNYTFFFLKGKNCNLSKSDSILSGLVKLWWRDVYFFFLVSEDPLFKISPFIKAPSEKSSSGTSGNSYDKTSRRLFICRRAAFANCCCRRATSCTDISLPSENLQLNGRLVVWPTECFLTHERQK